MKSTAVCHGPKSSFEIKTKRIPQSDKAVWVAEYSWWSDISGLLYKRKNKYARQAHILIQLSFWILDFVNSNFLFPNLLTVTSLP